MKTVGVALALCARAVGAVEDHTNDAMDWLRENTPSTLIVDVRTKAEYEAGHLEGAVLLQEIDMALCYEKYKEMTKSVSVYCYEKPYRSTPIAQFFSDEFPGLRVVDLGGLAYMEGAHIVTNSTNTEPICMRQPTSRPTMYKGQYATPRPTTAPVASPMSSAEAEAAAAAAAAAAEAAAAEAEAKAAAEAAAADEAAATDDASGSETAKASTSKCLFKFAVGAALLFAVASAVYYFRRKKFQAKMKPVLDAAPAKGEVQVAVPSDASKLAPAKETEDACAVQIAPEGAVADAEAPEVEKAASTELMSVVTEETSAPLEDGTPTSPAYEV